MANLELRHLKEDDLETMVDIDARSRWNHPYDRRLTVEEAKAFTFLDPDFDPEGSWLAGIDGETVGFCLAIVEKNRIEAGLDDGYCEVEVVPERRGQGTEQKLLDLALDYLRSKNVGMARARSVATDEWSRSLHETSSFEEEHRVYILVRREKTDPRQVPVPEGFTLRRKLLKDFSDADIGPLVEAFNDSFRDHIMFAPDRPERWKSLRDCGEDPMMLTLAVSEGVIVGVCLSEESVVFNAERGVKCGWINLLGVRPAFRRKGLASAMLADGMRWVLGQGMDTVLIGVLAKNEKALDLYKSFGFEKDQESIWYTRKLREP